MALIVIVFIFACFFYPFCWKLKHTRGIYSSDDIFTPMVRMSTINNINGLLNNIMLNKTNFVLNEFFHSIIKNEGDVNETCVNSFTQS